MDSPQTNGHRDGTLQENRDSGSPKASPRKTPTVEAIREWLVVHLSEQLGIDRCEIDICEPFASYGLSSSGAAMLSGDLNEWLQIQLSPTMAWEYPTIDRLARHLAEPHETAESNGNHEPVGRREREPIAIIGLGCRFPGAADPESFWQLLQDGRDAITEAPTGRWQESSLHHSNATHWGGFLPQVDLFDPQFFGISPREGARMDPQQRLLLEVAWEALENAGKAPDKLAGSSTGIFVGISNNDYRQFQFADLDNLDAYAATGNAFSIAANRLSYFLDLKGPSVALDTACSSSLVAVHMACRSLRTGECNMALAGGVNLILSPDLTLAFSKAQMMAADGRCKTFDASADGYVRGEGCGIVVLKLLSDALRDGDLVVAVVRGSAVNQDGRSNGLTAPHGPAQQAVVRQAIEDARVAASQISYVEAHGTGTALGDPIEVQSLWEVLKENRLPENQCAIGSVKTNIGHLEAAAGIAGLMKAALCLQHRRLTPHLHLNRINPRIPLENMALVIPTSLQPWTTNTGSRIAGVSSFGFGGTNAHVILEEATITAREKTPADTERPLHILSLSTQTENSLQELCGRYANHLDAHPELPAQSVCFTANTGRAHFGERLTVIGATSAELSARLRAAITGHKQTGNRVRKAHHRKQPKIVFLYTGQGSQYAGMARELYETQPTFRKALETCDEILRGVLEQPLLSVLYPTAGKASPLDETTYTQPALFALQCALTELWSSWGIRPDAVMGHSVGAYAAAHAAGVFELEEGLKLIAQRARLIQSRSGKGRMAVVLADEARVAAAIHPHHGQVSIAAVNGPRNTVISGEPELIQTILESLKTEGIVTQALPSSRAFHSPFMDPVLDPFEQAARQVQFKSPNLPFISDATGARLQDDVVPDASYWRNHLRATIQFAKGIETLSAEGYEVFLEIGPTPSLLAMGKRCLPKDLGSAGTWLPSLKPGQSDWTPLLESLGEMYVQGADVDWSGFDRDYPRYRVSLPTYPFERQRCWMESSRRPNGAVSQNGFQTAGNELSSTSNSNTKEPAMKVETETRTIESQAASQATATRRNTILATISGIVARLLELDSAEINIHASLLEMGADSLVLLEAVRTVEKTFGVHLTIRQMFEDLTTLDALATYIDRTLPPEVALAAQHRVEKEAPPSPSANPVVALHAIHGNGTSPVPETPLERIVAQQLEVMSRVMLQQVEALRSNVEAAKAKEGPFAEATPRQNPGKHSMPIVDSVSFGTVGDPGKTAPGDMHGGQVEKENPSAEPYVPFRPIQPGSIKGWSRRQQDYVQSLTSRFTERTRKSRQMALADRSVHADLRNSLNFRLTTKEMCYPIAAARSQGPKIWDVDGNEYIDLTMGFGVNLFGHGEAFIQEAIAAQMKLGMHLGPQSDLAGEVARLICDLTGMERVTFCNSGSESVMTAIRLARAATGRSKVAIFSGSYHGASDSILAKAQSSNGNSHSHPMAPGVTQGMVEDLLVLNYGSQRSLEILKASGRELAAILVEPVQSRRPDFQPKDFLRQLREIANAGGAALIFDEVITGFRVHPGGAQAWFGIQADLATYGKVIGGGMPIGVVAGRKRFMDGIDGGSWQYGDLSYPEARTTFYSGTFCKHPLAMSAARAVLRRLKDAGPDLQEQLNQKSAGLADTLDDYFEKESLPIRMAQFGSLFRFTWPVQLAFAEDPELFYYQMVEKGIYIWEGRNCFLSTAHTPADIDRVVKAVKESAAEMREGGFLLPSDDTFASRESKRKTPAIEIVPLTDSQKNLWILVQMGQAKHDTLTLELQGPLHLAALRRALQKVAERHGALRARIGSAGEVQEVLPALIIDAPLIDFSHLDSAERPAKVAEWLTQESRTPFDLSSAPLWRVNMLKTREQEHILVLTAHHILVDGWSIGLIVQELSSLYTAECTASAPQLPSPMHLAEYVQWKLTEDTGSRMVVDERYWLDKLSGDLPVLELPTDYPRPAVKTYEGARESLTIDLDICLGLKQLSKQQGCTLFMTLLAGYITFLHRTTGQDDIVIGFPVSGRSAPGSENLVAYCAHLVPVRSSLKIVADDDPVFAEYLTRVRKILLEAYEHQDYPFARLIEKLNPIRDPGRAPIVNATFNLERRITLPPLHGLNAVLLPPPVSSAEHDLDLNVTEVHDQLLIDLVYNTGLFNPATVQRMLGHYRTLLTAILVDPDQRTSTLPLLTDSERWQLLVEWNDTRVDYPPDLCFHHLFESQAEKTPHEIALVFEDKQLTYRQLDQQSNQLGHYLRGRGVGPEVRVGICVERSPEMVVALLSVLKAGGAYLPLDPGYPAERMRFMLEDAQAAVVLTQSGLLERLQPCEAWVVCLDREREEIRMESEERPVVQVWPENLAYIYYTSGSTGRPKGVAMAHSGIVNYVLWGVDGYEARGGNGSAVHSSIAVDLTLTNFLPLFTGQKVMLASETAGVEALVELMQAKPKWSFLKVTPTHLTLLNSRLTPEEMQHSTRVLVIGADNLVAEPTLVWRELAPGVKLLNEYGPTETVVGCSIYRIGEGAPRQGGMPIGKPIANITMYVLDRQGEPLPVGVPGELYIGGVGVARGYWGRPDLTAEKFVPDQFAGIPGARFYRTGDRARFLEDGNLEFLGRVDHQVKIRGYRIEPEEVEAVLSGHGQVQKAMVVVREDKPGEKQLVAYVGAGKEWKELTVSELRAHVRARLPEYMVPSVFVVMEQLPVRASGKIDPRDLPVPDGVRPAMEQEETAARTPTEKALAAIWADVLGLDRVGVHDNFFDLGGHSLLAMRVISRMKTELQVEPSVRALFEAPTVAQLAGIVERARGTVGGQSLPALRKQSRLAPLSFAQERLWFLQHLQPESPAYHLPVILRLQGALNVEALSRSLSELVRRHESLRTKFQLQEAVPVQLPMEAEDMRLTAERITELQPLLREELRRPFDLKRGRPLRTRLLQPRMHEYVLVLVMHHIVSDGWSIGVLLRELSALYTAFSADKPSPLLPLEMQYADFAIWQREVLQGELLEQELNFWKEQLKDAPAVLELPIDRARPAVASYHGARQLAKIPVELKQALRILSRREGATLYMTMLAAFQVLLGKYASQTDVVVGTSIAGRTQKETEPLIGMFFNMLALRGDLSGNPSFRELLAQVRETALQAYAHQDLPFEHLIAGLGVERSLSYNPLFQVIFEMQNEPRELPGLPGLQVSWMEFEEAVAKVDLTLSMVEGPETVEDVVEYSTDLFDDATIGRMMGHYRTLLEDIVANPETRIGELRLLTAEERKQIVKEWNATEVSYAGASCLHELFEKQAGETPEKIAVLYAAGGLSYRELNARANQLGRYLQKLGVGPEERVGICVERSPEMVVALLGVLKAGGAYLPLDPGYPAERMRYMLKDAQAGVVVTQSGLVEKLQPNGARVVCLDREWEEIEKESTERPVVQVRAENLAYIYYTSGSTGRPKGVAMAHSGIVNYMRWGIEAYEAPGGSGAPVHSSIAVDLTLTNFLPLFVGQKMVLAPETHGVEALVELMQAKPEWSLLKVTPTHLTLLNSRLTPEEMQHSTRVLVIGADNLVAEPTLVWRELAPGVKLLNEYGPTETVVGCSIYRIGEGSPRQGGMPIGKPISNIRMYVLDQQGGPLPVGVPGELYIGGVGVARGYWGRPDLTAEKFVPDGLSGKQGERLYRTGDRARFLKDGNLEFLGRMDHQVKIRGYRIEPGEVEAVLSGHGQVLKAMVVVREDEPGEKRLVGYVGAGPEWETLTVTELRAYVKERLPEYMVPSTFVVMEQLPMRASGKIDPRDLPVPDGVRPAMEQGETAARTPTEEALAGIWADVLRLDRVGVHDNFFDVGGDSLLAMRVISRIRAKLKVETPVQALFEAPTVAQLAVIVERSQEAVGRGALSPQRSRVVPLSFAQERLWFLQQLQPENPAYHLPVILRLKGDLNLEALNRSLSELVRRHESLRTRFQLQESGPVQIPMEAEQVRLTVERVTEAQQRLSEELRRPFDLERDRPLRVRLLQLEKHEHVLALVVHHIVGDGWSMGVLQRELSVLYAAFSAGRPSPLLPLEMQYADFAIWQRSVLQGELLERELNFWKEQLKDAPAVLELPTDRPRPAVASYHGARQLAKIPAGLKQALKTLSRREGATLYMTMLAAFQALLGRYAGQTDLVVGTSIAGRTRKETEPLIGMFFNTLALRGDLSGNPSFRDLLGRVRKTALQAYAHQEMPFERLVAGLGVERNLSYNPLFQVIFEMQNEPRGIRGALEFPDLQVSWVEMEGTVAKVDLTLSMVEDQEEMDDLVEYSTDLFDDATIGRMMGHYRTLLEDIVANPETRIGELRLLTAEERKEIVQEWNTTEISYAGALCLHELFEEHADRTPEKAAVLYATEGLSYRDLDARANQVARYLQKLGARAEVRIGICVERSLEMVVTLLGVLKAGAAYLPLDPGYPAERMRYMLEDVQADVVVTQEQWMEKLQPTGARIVCLDREWEEIRMESEERPVVQVWPENLAYIYYTSGSTGRPKGVAMAHSGIVNYIRWGIEAYEAREGNGAAAHSSIAVDLTLTSFLPLFTGQKMVLASEKPGVEGLVELMQSKPEWGLLKVTPTHLTLLNSRLTPEEMQHSTRVLVIGADNLVAEPTLVWREQAPGVKLLNEYGPTETVVGCSIYRIGEGSPRQGGMPIGKPISNIRMYVLDQQGGPLPVGVPGELYIGGVGVARGYWGRPDLTAEKFVPDGLSGKQGERLYRTGDRARFLKDGNLEFLGRMDHQVKIRGYRIEPGEVEAVLSGHGQVLKAMVVVREDEPGEKRLVAYVGAGKESDRLTVTELRAYVKERLPEYMVPSVFVVMEQLPVRASGKIDPRDLPVPERARPMMEQAYESPVGDTETALARIWAEVLKLEQVGRHDNFFQMGGDSILSLQVIARSRQAGLHFTPTQLFQHQTIAELAKAAGASLPIEETQGPITGKVPLTPVQYWFFEQNFPSPHHWNQSLLLEVDLSFSASHIERALQHLIFHHDALRLRFEQTATGRQQTIAAPGEVVRLHKVDISRLSVAKQSAAIESATATAQAGLNLAKGPVLHVTFFDFGAEKRARLLLIIHHLVIDGVSWRILVEDLQTLCLQASRDEALQLPPKTSSFKQWAERLTEYAASEPVRSEASYWLADSSPTVPGLPVDYRGGMNTEASLQTTSVSLSADETRALLQDLPRVFHTRINDVLLTALALAFRQWTGRPSLLVNLEGHGREAIFADIDLSRTIGWFTAIFPMRLNLDLSISNPAEALQSMRRQRRRIPNGGIGYGLVRYLNSDPETSGTLRYLPHAEVVFNYLGQFDSLLGEDSLLTPVADKNGADRGTEGHRCHLLEINAQVARKQLTIDWGYSRNVHREETVASLAQGYIDALRSLLKHCQSVSPGKHNPFDFPLVDLNESQLDAVIAKVCPPGGAPSAEGIEDIYPLSSTQQGLLFHGMLAPDSGEYFEQLSAVLDGLDVSAFERAWRRVVERQPIFRTAFVWEGLKEPVQVVRRHVRLDMQQEDWRGLTQEQQRERLESFLQRDRATGFNLSQAPLAHLALMRLTEKSHQFILSYHHLLLDGWSSSLLFRELFALYEALRDGRELDRQPGRPYRDYIAWLEQHDVSKHEAYWRRTLKGITSPTRIQTRQLPRAMSDHGVTYGKQFIRLSEATTFALQSLVRRHHLTMNTVMLGAWALVLGRHCDTDDVLCGVTVSGRPHSLAGVDDMLGLFINTLPMRIRIDRRATALSWCKQLQDQQVEWRQYEYSPLVRVHGWSEIPRSQPLFESVFVFENYPMDDSLLNQTSSVAVRNVRFMEEVGYPISIAVEPGPEMLLAMGYDTGRFEESHVARMLDDFRTLLERLIQGPEQELSSFLPRAEANSDLFLKDVALLSEAERRQVLVEFNQTEVSFPRGQSVSRLFDIQCAKTPGRSAVICRGRSLTYSQLKVRVDRVASRLRALGVGPEVVVALAMQRGIDFLTAILAVFKAGGAYLPLDPSWPHQRSSLVLTRSRSAVLLVDSERRSGLAQALGTACPRVECVEDLLKKRPLKNKRFRSVEAGHLAYVIYTSGSTGMPKGAMVQHSGMLNHLFAMIRDLHLTRRDVIAQTASQCFDISVWQFLAALLVGGQVDIVDDADARDPARLLDCMRRDGITVIETVPSMMTAMMDNVDHRAGTLDLPTLRWFMCGGEAMPPQLAARWFRAFPRIPLRNEYGPTECSIIVSYHLMREPLSEDAATVPIGRPIANVRLCILDDQFQPVPIGTAGELCAGGVGVGRGYLDDPARTAELFVPDPFSGQPGTRLYKTGDLARHDAGGNIEYLGRIDHQIKIRGVRIELGEIETALAAHPAVRAAIVTDREQHAGERYLAAYIVPNPAQTLVVDEVRAFLEQRLPDAMVPAVFVTLPALPLTANGKVDRRALPVPDRTRPELLEGFVAPRDDWELGLTRIWEEILEIHPIGVRDNFFDLGGHSLLAVRLRFQIHKMSGRELPLALLFERPTIEALAQVLRQQIPVEISSLVPIKPSGSKPPLFFVHAQGGGTIAYYNLAQHLGTDQPFYGLEAPGLNGQQEPLPGIPEMAAHYLQELRRIQPEGPYRIGGHSFGGLVAFEMARQLHKEGTEVAMLAILDTSAPVPGNKPFDPAGFFDDRDDATIFIGIAQLIERVVRQDLAVSREELDLLDPEAQLIYFLEKLKRVDFVAPDAGPSLIRGFLAVERAVARAFRSYESQAKAYPGSMTLFMSADIAPSDFRARDRKLRDDPTLGWSELVFGEIETHTVPGDHISMLNQPNVQILAHKLATCLDRAVRCSPRKEAKSA
jgi:amino acid adenylation domain-containing protein/non-ribosomal peptide synthase protein (TIGR01720 family)